MQKMEARRFKLYCRKYGYTHVLRVKVAEATGDPLEPTFDQYMYLLGYWDTFYRFMVPQHAIVSNINNVEGIPRSECCTITTAIRRGWLDDVCRRDWTQDPMRSEGRDYPQRHSGRPPGEDEV